MASPTPLFLCALLLGSGVLAPAAPAQEASAAPTPLWLGDPGVDVAKARAHLLAQRADRLRWERATSLDDYERIGQKDPRWDADAHTALDEFSHMLAQGPGADAHSAAAKAACQRALDAGCKDPLLAYAALRLGLTPAGTDAAGLARLYARAEQDMEHSGYSPLRKLYASFRAAEQASKAAGPSPKEGEPPPLPTGTDLEGSLARARLHLVELLRDPLAQRDSVFAAAQDFLSFAQHQEAGRTVTLLGFSRHQSFSETRVLAPLAQGFESGELKDAGQTATGQLVKGLFWIDYGWHARTTHWAHEVTDEGWRLFADRLAKARTALESAYTLDPADPNIPRELMTVELGQGKGRAQLETWFRRTMDADPDSWAACDAKLYYLEPKWYGNASEMLAFGHECLGTANWPARLPFILLQAHTNLAASEEVPLDYWKRPAVWADVQKLFEAALAANPGSIHDRSGYALYAYRAEQWKLADKLFQTLGNQADLEAIRCTRAQYDEMRQTAAGRAAAN